MWRLLEQGQSIEGCLPSGGYDSPGRNSGRAAIANDGELVGTTVVVVLYSSRSI